MDIGLRGEEARDLAEHLLRVYFQTHEYPYTRHHIESYDQFLSQDLPAIIKAQNPILVLQDQIARTGVYAYKAEIFVGGLAGDQITIGTPTVTLKDSEEVRLLFPNEARLRNLTYSSTVEANILIRLTLSTPNPAGGQPISQEIIMDPVANPTAYGYLARFPLFRIPIMLHSRYCLLNGKPQEFLKEVGECQYDSGGYFIINGAEKVLITHQEQAFNTLYITPQERDPKISIYSSITCLNPKTRQVKRVSFGFLRRENTLQVSLPYVRKPVPVFILFRALGVQSDSDILRLIFPDPDAEETALLEPMLRESILEAFPFYDTYSAVQYIKVLTKGFSEAHVLHVLYNQTFIHVENRPKARATFLAECVRRILRVKAGLDTKTDRDDTRNQRCLTSGILTRMLFQGVFHSWVKMTQRNLSEEYKYHTGTYQGMNFQNLFLQGTLNKMFNAGMMTDGLMRAFKGKWSSGSGAGVGEEKSGVLQALSRLSYMDFMSHCRRVVLDFDTGMKMPGPRRLHTSQYGYFCTNETPTGASIGITKNLSMLTAISTATDPAPFIEWLYKRGGVTPCDQMTPAMVAASVPVFVNAGIVGYTVRPAALRDVLKVLKWVGGLPATASVGFSVRDRRIFVFLDEGRPVRPLIHLGPRGQIPIDALKRGRSWRDLVLGVLPLTKARSIYTSGFVDPLASEEGTPSLEDYVSKLAADAGVVEYVDPYEMNETFVANFPEHIQPETSHMEIHPSTIVGLLTSMIPYANHNQSPRNQLSCSQSKQGLSVYSTAYPLRYDNQVHVLCYSQAPIARTLYYDYLAEGQMSYGTNLILAMGSFTGYNQDDGIVMNADSVERGMFRSTCYRTYEAFEEDDDMTGAKTRIANPAQVPGWTSLKPGVDYTKLDERGIIRVGEMVDETTVLVGRYLQSTNGDMKDASVTAQVWTRGRVEKVAVTIDNAGFVMVKVRVVQERKPELGDKFCLTPDHEVLTKDGWTPIDKVSKTQSVAQLNRETGALEYVKPNDVFQFDHKGDMYEVKTQGVNLCTTLNHRMWVQQRNSKEFGFAEAKEMMGRRVRFSSYSPTSAPPLQLTIGEEQLKDESMGAFLTLFGIWVAEGCVNGGQIEISANKPRVKAALEGVSSALSLQGQFVESSKRFFINNKAYGAFLEPLSAGATRKSLPSWCFELSQEQSKVLLEAMCLGDGHETATSLFYSTPSLQLRDDVQILAQHAGYTSGYIKDVEEGSTRVDSTGHVYKANADNWHIQIRRKRGVYPTLNHGYAKTRSSESEEIVQYEGKVYCLSVPSEVFLVRRQGTIVWTGNSNRHGQKGTIGMLIRGYDMPRTRDGIPVDMIMNPHAIPSRMTVAQLLEALVGKAATGLGAVGNCTLFMNEGNPAEEIGKVLRDQLGMEPMGEELLYDGMSGQFVPSQVFMGNVYTMRLKHMPEDKWNARAEGRKEQRTHQPTGGRGAQGGLRIGEMERDAILAHGAAGFMRESLMKRADGYSTWICNGCGTIPVYNEKEGFFLCSNCDGPVRFIGENASNLEILPPTKRSVANFSKIEMPYALKLLDQEMGTFMNMGMRFLTDKDLKRLRRPELKDLTDEQQRVLLETVLPERVLPETVVPERIEEAEEPEVRPEDLAGLAAIEPLPPMEEEAAVADAAAADAVAAVAAVPAVPAAPVAANGLPTVVLQPPAATAEQLPSLEDGLAPAAAAAPAPQQGTVQVQTANQPVLVVPVNVAQQQQPQGPMPTEMAMSGIPGAPPTFAVDTSPSAMASLGLPSVPGLGAANNRSRSNSRVNGAGASAAAAPNARVNVSKMGASPAVDAATSNPNIRVSVTKQG